MAKRTRPFHETGKGERPEQGAQAKKKKINVEKRKSNNPETIVATPKNEESVPSGETGVETWSKSKKKRMRMIKAKQQKSQSADFSNTSSRNPTTSSSPTTTMIEGNINTSVDETGPVSKASKLQNEFKARLSGSRFRTLNEELYTTTSDESYERFSKNPELFEQYHEGFRKQVESWPVNPVDVIVRWLASKYQKHKSPQKNIVVADFGCGDAQLAKDLMRIPQRNDERASSSASPFTVHSFDLVSQNEWVTACDMANVPLPNKSVDVCVFCLSLMGTNLADFIREAHRVLKDDGKVKIAEVRSRIEYSHSKSSTTTSKKKNTTTGADDDEEEVDTKDNHNHRDKKTTKNAGTLNEFLDILKLLGFKCIRKDLSNKMFLLLELEKTGKAPDKTLAFSAKPCIYKRR